MDGKTHLVIGLVAGAGCIYLENKFKVDINVMGNAKFLIGCAIGSLIPDTDIRNSMLGRFIPLWLLFEHRTVTHSILFVLIIGFISVVFGFGTMHSIGICVGAITHLALDAITPMGLPYIFFPLYKD